MKKIAKGVLLPLMLLFSALSFAQNKTVTGTITGENGALVGASVAVKNASIGTTTNENGAFTLSVPSTARTLVISSIGYEAREVDIPASGAVSVSLVKSTSNLDEVVVVGYGTQKKSVVTGAISSVRAKDLEKVPGGRIEQALQGRVSGVTILQNSGQPGSNSTIRVRGVTTFGGDNNNPLWVVDGVVVDAGGIGYLNQNDIESIEVLKDAASAAIYGTRAATGVILVTTKKGKAGKPTISYNGYYGTQSPAKMLKLLNGSEYAALMNERAAGGGDAIPYPDLSIYGKGTDWQKAIFNNSARRFAHDVSISAGNDRSTFYFSVGIQDQEGLVMSDISHYTRKFIRLNSTHKISNVFTFGETVGYTHQKGRGIATNTEFGGPLSSAINLDPITPLIETDPLKAALPPYTNLGVIRDANGNPYGISPVVGQEMTNPIAFAQTKLGQYDWSDDIVGNAYLEATIAKDFKLRSTFGAKKAFWGNEGFNPVYYLNPTNGNTQNNIYKTENKGFNWNIENTLTYTHRFGDHNVTALLGQGVYVENIGGSINITMQELPITSWQDASFGFDIPVGKRQSGASEFVIHKLSSLFARVNYAYQDKYLFTGIVRRDGGTRFGLNHKYGVFPSFSAGWVVSKENFWTANDIINNLKIRGGYGKTGNDAIANFGYLSRVGGGFNYAVGNTGAVTTGYAPLSLDNPDLHWEETAMTNFGFEAQLARSFNLTVDYFKKRTTGILRPITIPGYVGVSESPVGNVADMDNSGVEVELGYQKRFGDLIFSANGNVTYLKNNVTFIANDANFIGGDASFQSMNDVTRTQVGHPYNEFYGYKTNGIFQNWAEITNNKNATGGMVQPDAQPGDFRWVDENHDGTINDDDKVFLGNSLPKYTFGLTINLEYKGFDFMLFAQGVAGNKIFQGLRRLDVGNANYQTEALARWTGEGTSNTYPRLSSDDPNGNFGKMSDFYLEKGDYARLKVLQVGYTIPGKLYNKYGVARLRVYITAENLLTLTNYTGYDPEIGGNVFGVDKGQYPQARSILGGIQLQF